MSSTAIDKLDKLIREFDTAMLVTRSLNGVLRARPMAIADHGERGALYFVTRSDDEKLGEIMQSPGVAVTMQTEGKYLSISGEARVLTDQVLAEELWSAAMRLWFPEGPGDSNLTVLLVEPWCAEYWDRTGIRRLDYWWEAGKALAKGEKVEDQALGGHKKVEL